MHAGQVCWRRIAQRMPGRPFDTRNEDNRSAGTVTRVFVEASFSSFNLQPKTGRDNSHSGAECAVCIYRIAFSICQERMRNYFRSAGWSSLVARQAHNLKAAGSNPAPATNHLPNPGSISRLHSPESRGQVLYRSLGRRRAKGCTTQHRSITLDKRTRSLDYRLAE